MPVIVTPDKYDVWLDPDVNDFNTIRGTLKPYDANQMRRYLSAENSTIQKVTTRSPRRPSR